MEAANFFPIWYRNNFFKSGARAVNAIATPCLIPSFTYEGLWWIQMLENLGHVDSVPRDQQLTGWSASFLMGCMLAYHARADMIYLEQDCLAFGSWVDVLYGEIGNAGMITGHANTSGNSAGGDAGGLTAQSLVLVKNAYLLPFVQKYLAIPETDAVICNEDKFDLIGREGQITQTSMGYDRSRPVNFSDSAFYMQQISAAELAELRARGLV